MTGQNQLKAPLAGALLFGLGAAACAPVLHHPDFPVDCDALNANVDCVRVFYGTNREVFAAGGVPAVDAEADIEAITDASANALSLGRADIWLPRLIDAGGTRERGDTPTARGRAPEDVEEQEQYVFITRITAAGRERFVADLADAVSDSGGESILLFVHGFNVAFEPALIRSAQLAVDLREDRRFDPGAPVLFSWPSLGRMSISAYRQDGNRADEAVPHLRAFLDLLVSDTRATRLNIVAHSMGNRVLTQALEDYAAEYLAREDRREIEFRIVLAAADVERDIFDQVADHIGGLEPNVTIYTSDDDLALGVSRLINRAARLGETDGDRPYIRDAVDYATVDATGVASELFGVGHGYYSENPFILNDIRCALADIPAEQRALARARYGGEPEGREYFLTMPDAAPSDDNCALRRQSFPAGRIAPAEYPVPPPPPPPAPPPPPPPPPLVCPAMDFSVYFDFDSAALNENAAVTIDEALARARHCPIAQVLVTGHADAAGDPAYNAGLSERRASAVRDALVARGVEPDVINVEARGEAEPARPTGDDVSEPLNRRVSVRIQYR